MKYIIIVPDGMSDLPLKEFNGRTPLEVAKTPFMDFMAKEGIVGCVNNVPKGMQPGSDVANLSLLGYNPAEFYTGRGPFEAKSLGIDLKKEEMAFRCNLVTVSDDGIMVDYSAGHISSKEAQVLIKHVDEMLGSDIVRFYPGMSYRHILVVNLIKAGVNFDGVDCTAPHDILSESIKKHMPKGNGSDFLINLMNESKKVLEHHDINHVRIDLKENPGNMIWLWGGGQLPPVKNFFEKFRLKGSLISAVGLLKGIALAIGLNPVDVPGITGYYDTNYSAKAEYGLKALEKDDFLFLHIEAPDEAGHNGDVLEKVKAIENIDKKVIGPVIKTLQKRGEKFRILVCPDHPTPLSLRTHTADNVPFVMYGEGIEKSNVSGFSEAVLKLKGIKKYNSGHEMVEEFLK